VNILIVCPWTLSETGGVTSAVAMLAQEFAKKGHAVTVFVTDGDHQPTLLGEHHGVPEYGMYLRVPTSGRLRFRTFASFLLMLPITLYRLYRFLLEHKIEGIIIQYPIAPAFYFGILRWLNRWKLIIVYQGSDAHELHCWTALDRYLVHILLNTSDTIVAVSKTLLGKVFKVFPDLRAKRNCLIPNGAPLHLLDQSGDVVLPPDLPRTFILTAGRLIQRKGIDVLIEALRLAKEGGAKIDVVIAGDGPERLNLLRLADQAEVLSQVHLIGTQSHEQVIELMKRCLFFVLASRAEGLPLVIAEAMACEKPVIASDVDGVPDIVDHGRTGLLVPPEDARSLADAVMKLYSNVLWRHELGRAAKEMAVQRFSWSSIADRYLQRLTSQEVSK
jgi:glycosyltransferase involved in cell wall biosynthesis